jgi:hypothetical protein
VAQYDFGNALGDLGAGLSQGIGGFVGAQQQMQQQALAADELKRKRMQDGMEPLAKAAYQAVSSGQGELAIPLLEQLAERSKSLYGVDLSGQMNFRKTVQRPGTPTNEQLTGEMAKRFQGWNGGAAKVAQINPAGYNAALGVVKDQLAQANPVTETQLDVPALDRFAKLFYTPKLTERTVAQGGTLVVQDEFGNTVKTLKGEPKPPTPMYQGAPVPGWNFNKVTGEYEQSNANVPQKQQIVVGPGGVYTGVNPWNPGAGGTSTGVNSGAYSLAQAQADVRKEAQRIATIKDQNQQAMEIEKMVQRRRSEAARTAGAAGMPLDEATLDADDAAYHDKLTKAVVAYIPGPAPKPKPSAAPVKVSANTQQAMTRVFGPEYVAAYQQYPEVKAYEDYLKRRETGKLKAGERSPVSAERIKAIREAIRSGKPAEPTPGPSQPPAGNALRRGSSRSTGSWESGMSPAVRDILASAGVEFA